MPSVAPEDATRLITSNLPRWISVKTAVVLLSAAVLANSCGPVFVEREPDWIYVRLKKNPNTLDPARIVDLDSARVAAKLFNALVGFDDQLQPIGDLARSWTLSSDGRIYRFILRDDAIFFNGRPVTAHDVVYSFERVLAPPNTLAAHLGAVAHTGGRGLYAGALGPGRRSQGTGAPQPRD